MVPTVATTGWFGPSAFRGTDGFGLAVVVGAALGLAAVSWWAFAPARVEVRPTATPSGSTPATIRG